MNHPQIFGSIFLATLCAKIISLNIGVKRAGEFFIIRRSVIVQRITRSGKEELRKHRKKQCGKTFDQKLRGLALFLIRELPNVFDAMEVGKSYRIHTHLDKHLEHSASKKNLTIINKKQTRRRFLIEALPFLGIKDFTKAVLSKEDRKKLWKQFYKMTIKKM